MSCLATLHTVANRQMTLSCLQPIILSQPNKIIFTSYSKNLLLETAELLKIEVLQLCICFVFCLNCSRWNS